MSEKMCPKIILEGTRLTDKTEIADWLESTGGMWARG